MNKYEVIGLLGEGSFGRVYKAKRNSDSTFVALKVISKRGRTLKELKGLRRECEIQRHLNHPNIIQMLDSFETENEIVVITEFAHKELNYILGKEGCLQEERVQLIVWDLVSALYYLHSHRVLHRDLKPQNILLDTNNVAKLCDFGFARNMSTGTHVLTSIKGTPLYMAPELIEEQPYDHNADLWSLGCIIYELLVGAPPFCTPSILHLIRLIKHEQIEWPTSISEECTSFLKGLLQKNPLKRLTWPEILDHPFVKGHVLITANSPARPLTRPMSANTIQVKEKQRSQHISKKCSKANRTLVDKETTTAKSKQSPSSSCSNEKSANELNEKISKLSIESVAQKTPELTKADPLDFNEDIQPIESDEWIVFLQKTMEEIMSCEIGTLLQATSTNILVTPLRNANASPKVIEYASNLFSLPFVVPGIDKTTSEQIVKVYLEVKLVPNLIYSSKLLLQVKQSEQSQENKSDGSEEVKVFKEVLELNEEELQCLENVYLLICHLVHVEDQFLSQFCDSVAILRLYQMVKSLFCLNKKRFRIVADLLGILTCVLRQSPENSEVVDRILNEENIKLDFLALLRSSERLLRERCCNFVLQLAKRSPKTLEGFWSQKIQDTIEALEYDSIENVRNAAEITVEELKNLEFYVQCTEIKPEEDEEEENS